jgi:hypothetical protein
MDLENYQSLHANHKDLIFLILHIYYGCVLALTISRTTVVSISIPNNKEVKFQLIFLYLFLWFL